MCFMITMHKLLSDIRYRNDILHAIRHTDGHDTTSRYERCRENVIDYLSSWYRQDVSHEKSQSRISFDDRGYFALPNYEDTPPEFFQFGDFSSVALYISRYFRQPVIRIALRSMPCPARVSVPKTTVNEYSRSVFR